MNISYPDKLPQILSTSFGITEDELKEWYQTIINSFNANTADSYSGFHYADKFYSIPFSTESARQNWAAASLIGIDLPVEVTNGKKDQKRAVIIGIDPLRKRKDFPESVSKQKIIIGSPYALHSSFYRNEEARTKIYFEVIQELLEQNLSVYVTDLHKLWMNNDVYERSKYSLHQEFALSNTLLSRELEIISPSKIILFGSYVYNYTKPLIKYLGYTDRVIRLPHPSGANRNWNKLPKEERSFQGKKEWLIKDLELQLNNSTSSSDVLANKLNNNSNI
jgi:hypothetical protein